MIVNKTALKKMIDSAKPDDLLVATVSSLDKNGQRKVRSELEKFMSKSGEYILTIIKI